MALAAVQQRQDVISAVAAGSSVAAMFLLFITHDEYFVRCGGNGGGYYDVLICPATIVVDKNSVMYGLHTNIVPQYGYVDTN